MSQLVATTKAESPAGTFTAPQLKLLQEVVSLGVFSLFALTYLREPLRWNDLAAFGLVLAAVYVSLHR